MRCLILLIVLTALASSARTDAAFDSSATSDGGLSVLRIVPTGLDVPPGRQIVIDFDRPVVPIGEMARTDKALPIAVTPHLDCQWRWLNTQSLACQLGEDDALAAATEYTVVVSPGITTVEGVTMDTPLSHRFTTERPDVRWTRFVTWRSPTTPVIRIFFNQPVHPDSVSEHLYFLSPDGQSRVAVKLIDDPSHRAPSEVWELAPVAELPADTTMHLMVEPGLRSNRGPEPGIGQRVVVEFDTFPAFSFLGVRCLEGSTDQWVSIAPALALSHQPKCDPLHGVGLIFSAPVINEEVRSHLTLDPDLAGGRKDYDPWRNRYSYSALSSTHERGNTYVVWLPEHLQAFETYTIDFAEASLRDEFSRPLPDAVSMVFATAHRRPNLHLNHPTAVVEKAIDSDVPLYVTNLHRVKMHFNRLTHAGLERHFTRQTRVPAVEDIAFAVPLQVRALLEGKSGVVSGKLTGDPEPPHTERSWRFFAQVTPFQVHVKLGHFRSIAWVTDLTTGQPVEGAGVDVFASTYESLAIPANPVWENARTDSQGVAQLPGLETIDPHLRTVFEWRENHPRWFVRVRHNDDMALLPLDGEFRAWSRGVWPSTQRRFGHLKAWGTTAQGVYRAGDTLQYKLYVRNEDNQQLVPAPESSYTLQIMDPQGRAVDTRENLSLSAFGSLSGELKLASDAPVGWYRFVLSASFNADQTWEPLRVLVSDFTPAAFRVTGEPNTDQFDAGDTVEVLTRATLHSGGPYTNAETRVTARLRAEYFRSSHPLAQDFSFHTQSSNRHWQVIHQSVAVLDETGSRKSVFEVADNGIQFGQLQVESAVRDDRGKYVAHLASATYISRDRFVGLRNTQWVYEEDQPAEIEYIVVDVDGQPVTDSIPTLVIEREVVRAARVKGAGNAYLTRYDRTWQPVHTCSSTVTDSIGRCRFVPDEPGRFRITATVADTKGRLQTNQIGAWVHGKGQVVWETPNDNSLRIIPEDPSPQVGDTARFLIHNPFPGARALVTVERYGVMEQWVELLDTSTPIVTLEIKPEHLPGFYLSVVVQSPRVAAPVTGGVDLGKPAFRMGYVKVELDDPYKRLDIGVSTRKDTYKPRDSVQVDVTVAPDPSGSRAPVELAVAVLDEAVFDLIQRGLRYFDPYRGFYSLRSLDVLNYGLLTRLVGRQKFEKKGANAGGDGGPGLGLRSDFRFVSYWNPSLATDTAGRASFTFTVPDNLTGWRVLVLGVSPSDRMGLGDTTIRVNQPTELRPVMPNQVVQGDVFRAGFSVMNRTDRARTVSVVTSATDRTGEIASQRVTLALAPFERRSVWMPVETTVAGLLKFVARAGDYSDHDQLSHTLEVQKRRSFVTAADYGTTIQHQVSRTVRVPEDVHRDSVSLSVDLSPSVIANVEGAFRYMQNYPYLCWEQRLSKAVMADHARRLDDYLPTRAKWRSGAALIDETLTSAHRFQAPNGGMVFWIAHDQHVSPYLSAYTALAFNWLRASGHAVPKAVETKLHDYLLELLRKDVMPGFYERGMVSSIRAVALAALAAHGEVTLDDLYRYEPHVRHMSLFAKAQYLDAARLLAADDTKLTALVHRLLAHANVTGGKYQFSESSTGVYRQMLATPLRANCSILGSLLELGGKPVFAKLIGDVPFKLVRSITEARGNRDHFENPQENVFCMNSLASFASIYEAQPPALRVTARLQDDALGSVEFSSVRDAPSTITQTVAPSSIGATQRISIERDGEGRVYYATRLTYAPLGGFTERTNAGMDLRREYSVQRNGVWKVLKPPMTVRRGELLRVDLYLSLPAPRHFVVVDDPVPGALEPVNRDLANTSRIDADAGEFVRGASSWWHTQDDWIPYGRSHWRFYHQELRHDAVRFFSDYLPAGNYHLSYTAQAIASGRFTVMPVHSEEMYDPDVFGKGVTMQLHVQDQ